jgi:hypothetical protein
MSAEGILADPCIFYTARHSLCSCSSLVNCVCAHDTRNASNITDKSGLEDQNSMREGRENLNANENETRNENLTENESIRGNSENILRTKSNKNRVPDRNALFCEYCVLSEMFLTAGGWRNIGMKDVTFDQNNDSENRNFNTNCCGSGGCDDSVTEEMIGECFRHTDLLSDLKCAHTLEALQQSSKIYGREEIGKKIDNDMISEGKKGNTDTVESDVTATVKTVEKVETVGKRDEEVEEERMKEIEKEKEEEKEGVEKQIEVARQHLYWMLEKKGHGRTVRFVHRGTYARHTDLLSDLKCAHTLEALQQISKICLSNVFGSNIYTNDNYDDY